MRLETKRLVGDAQVGVARSLAGGDLDNADYPRIPTRAGGGTYDPLGRRYFVGLNATF